MDEPRKFSELEAAGVVLTLWSEVLGETILLVPESFKPREKVPVAYTYEEARLLMEAGEDEARSLHLFKKALRAPLTRGCLMPSGRSKLTDSKNI